MKHLFIRSSAHSCRHKLSNAGALRCDTQVSWTRPHTTAGVGDTVTSSVRRKSFSSGSGRAWRGWRAKGAEIANSGVAISCEFLSVGRNLSRLWAHDHGPPDRTDRARVLSGDRCSQAVHTRTRKETKILTWPKFRKFDSRNDSTCVRRWGSHLLAGWDCQNGAREGQIVH